MYITNKIFSYLIKKRIFEIEYFINNSTQVQEEVLKHNLLKCKNTEFGKKYNFQNIKNKEDYRRIVPLFTYESFIDWIDKSKLNDDIIWKGKIEMYAKSSGTSNSYSKNIPLSKESLNDCHYKGGKDLLSVYYHRNKEADLFNGKHIILGGNRKIIRDSNIKIGDLSAHIIQNLPFWVEIKRIPKKKIAIMEDWENKIEIMAKSSISKNIKILAGVPSWTLVFLKKVLEIAQTDNIQNIWPNFELYMHGGVNFDIYRPNFAKIMSNTTKYYQTYNASEGFFAFQYNNNDEDLLLMLDYGIYYEFIPMNKYNDENSETINLDKVIIGQNYAIVISTNGGLWRYIIGDVITFTSKNPYKIKVLGRTKQYINICGEEVMIHNVENAILNTQKEINFEIKDYTLAPVINGVEMKYHWLIEFYIQPSDLIKFIDTLDNNLQNTNSDYNAKRYKSMILKNPQLTIVKEGVFDKWLLKNNKLGGQSKIPRLKNDYSVAREILELNNE